MTTINDDQKWFLTKMVVSFVSCSYEHCSTEHMPIFWNRFVHTSSADLIILPESLDSLQPQGDQHKQRSI